MLIGHQLLNADSTLIGQTGSAYTYIFGKNGVFAYAKRPGIQVVIPIELFTREIPTLKTINPQLIVQPKIPGYFLQEIYNQSSQCRDSNGILLEILFHITYHDGNWQLHIPSQIQDTGNCEPLEKDSNSTTQTAAVEVHSHGNFKADFSETDNQDEYGFRIYGIIGRLNNDFPEVKFRVGLFSNFWNVPVASIFDLSYPIKPAIRDTTEQDGCRFYYCPPRNRNVRSPIVS